jgi:tRNA-2-methylthio-N6-dimethylallyladenosine synthase
LSVLFEKPGRNTGQAIGRSPYLQSVHVEDASDLIGQIRDVKILGVFPNSLKGTLVGTRRHAMALTP